MRIWSGVLAALVATSCSHNEASPAFECPGTLTHLEQFVPTGSATPEGFEVSSVKLVTAEGTPAAFGLGIKRNCEGRGEVFLMGQGANGDWAELLNAESSIWNPVNTKVKHAWLGDFGGDGTADLLVHATITSTFLKNSRTRDFIVLASLGERIEYRFFFTLSLVGTWTGDCQKGEYDYQAKLDWEAPLEDKTPAAADFTWALKDKVCPGGCPGKVGPCGSANESGNGRFVWDDEYHAFLRPDTRTMVSILPDVDFGPGFRRIPR